MKPLSLDTETALIRPGLLAPPLTCVTYASEWEPKGDLLWIGDESSLPIARGWLSDSLLLIGHNVSYDLAVLGTEWPELLPMIFAALEADRVTDTGIRQKLIDIASGQFRGITDGMTGEYTAHEYSLKNIAQRQLGIELDKDEHRLGFGELRDVPPDEWPDGAAAYAVGDAVTTLAVWEKQNAYPCLADQFRQTRAAFGLHLISCWGIRTDPDALKEFHIETEDAYQYAVGVCEDHKLVRPDGSRDTKLAKRLMLSTCEELDISPKRTKGYILLRRKRDSKEELTTKDVKNLADPLFGVSLDEEACLETGDVVLKSYSEVSSLMTVIKTHIPALWNGTTGPIQPSFDSLVATGRASCKGYSADKPTNGYQMHNVRRMPGIRECFVPRPGKLFLDADYDGLELRTVSQVCLWALGRSRLAERLNAGVDVHIDLAAQLLGHTYDEAYGRYHDGAAEMDLARQFAKIGNFGFWGGMQAESFRTHARGQGIRRTLAECEKLHEAWHANWPETREYFSWIKAQCSLGGLATIEHFRSERGRGLVPFTVAANSFFQGLGADATKAALFAIQHESYVDHGTALFGHRMVNCVHDEFMGEVDDDLERSNAAAQRLVHVMCEAAAPWLPDVPPKATAALMRAWSKKAKPVFNEAGQLIPWEAAA